MVEGSIATPEPGRPTPEARALPLQATLQTTNTEAAPAPGEGRWPSKFGPRVRARHVQVDGS
eukprot:10034116-Alexandrium_andersonii.AAC.1